jgi:hypothetical protein
MIDRQVASAGALLLIFGVAVGPLSQELLHYDLRPQADPSSLAYISTALTWETTSQDNDMYTCTFAAHHSHIVCVQRITDSLFALSRGGKQRRRAKLDTRSPAFYEGGSSKWSSHFRFRSQQNSAILCIK